MRKIRTYATAAQTFDVDALIAEIDGHAPRVRRTAANDVARVQQGRVMPLPRAA